MLDNGENADNEDADNEESASMHDWRKVVHKRVRKRRTSLAHPDDGSGGGDGPSRGLLDQGRDEEEGKEKKKELVDEVSSSSYLIFKI
jgi:hypothetical protein